MAFKKKVVLSALEKKGFQQDNKRNTHLMYYLYDSQGQRTRVHTMISHNNKDIGGTLLAKMAKELYLSNNQTKQYFECTLSKEEYYSILITKGVI